MGERAKPERHSERRLPVIAPGQIHSGSAHSGYPLGCQAHVWARRWDASALLIVNQNGRTHCDRHEVLLAFRNGKVGQWDEWIMGKKQALLLSPAHPFANPSSPLSLELDGVVF